MIDAHCHVDLYPDPSSVARMAELAGVLTVMVTNLPSAFDRAYPHVRELPSMRLAVGMHPLETCRHDSERGRFRELLAFTSYVGEVGLDFSPQLASTRAKQVESFEFVLSCLQPDRKFVTVHSRRAEAVTLDLLAEKRISPVVFHWFTGPIGCLRRAASVGHLFSVNPAMIASERGRKIIENIPPGQVLTESDGPFVRVGGRVAVPPDVSIVEKHLAQLWRLPCNEVRSLVHANFRRILSRVGQRWASG